MRAHSRDALTPRAPRTLTPTVPRSRSLDLRERRLDVSQRVRDASSSRAAASRLASRALPSPSSTVISAMNPSPDVHEHRARVARPRARAYLPPHVHQRVETAAVAVLAQPRRASPRAPPTASRSSRASSSARPRVARAAHQRLARSTRRARARVRRARATPFVVVKSRRDGSTPPCSRAATSRS